MIWMWDNLLEDGFSASSEQPVYPASNVVDRFQETLWKAQGNVATVILSGTDLEVSGLSILNSNLTSGATVRLEGNDTNVWASPSFSQTFTGGGTVFETFTKQTYNYFRLFVEDTSLLDLEIGYLFLGDHLQTRGISQGAKINYKEQNARQFSRSNQIIGQTQYQYREASVKFPNLTNANRLEIKAVWDEVGSVKPIIVALWGDDHEAPIFAVLDQPTFTTAGNQKWTGSISFREVG